MMKPGTSAVSKEGMERRYEALDAFFSPRSVAVIGATESEGSVGRTVFSNLLATPFGGTVYPVNPKRETILGVKAYPSIADLPTSVDLAVIATPASAVPDVVRQCAQADAKSAIIVSAGFKELGAPGIELERRIADEARAGHLRIIGPNCLGVMNPLTGLNATFAGAMAKPGNVAFLSQSGALCTAILDWSLRESIGFSAFVSTGSMLDVGWGDLIDYLGRDPRTKSILIYMETIGDTRSFLSAAREVALSKPIIVIKPGRTEQAAAAAASHTGSMVGADDVLDAAFRRAGVLRVNTIADLFYMAEALARQPRPRGPKLAIVTNAGGPAVLATDALILNGGQLAPLEPRTRETLNALLPPHWSRGNPVDILGDARADRYEKTIQAVAADINADGLLVILTPQDMTQPTQTAELLKDYAHVGKPVIASWMGGPAVQAGVEILNRAGIPTFDYPDTAARIFTYMHRFAENLRAVYETPLLDEEDDAHDAQQIANADIMIDAALCQGRTLLTEHESKQLLSAYHIPASRTISCRTADQAIEAAESIGYSVVVKLESKVITHKSDVGGVKLNVRSAAEVRKAYFEIEQAVYRYAGNTVAGEARDCASCFDGVTVQPMVNTRDAYELIVGATPDPQFGPVMLVGTGGVLVEVFKDRALGLPPLNATLAGLMLEQTRIYTALRGVRGRKPVDMNLLKRILVRFSRLIVEHRRIREIDINPLLVSGDQVIALDARVVLWDADVKESDLPRTAIRPYPTQYTTHTTLRDGTDVLIKPIRPEDEPLLQTFHQTLSERTVMMRYFQSLQYGQRVSHERLTRVCFNDYDRELALVATARNESGARQIIGVGRLCKLPHTSSAEFALLISDQWQGKGLGTKLLELLLEVASREQVRRVRADILAANLDMQKVCTKLGFKLGPVDSETRTLQAEREIDLVPQ
jgi:acetyltransferase